MRKRPEPTIGNIVEALKEADPEAKVFFRPGEGAESWGLWEGNWFPTIEEVWTFPKEVLEQLKEANEDLQWMGDAEQNSMSIEMVKEYGLDEPELWEGIDLSGIIKRKSFVMTDPYS